MSNDELASELTVISSKLRELGQKYDKDPVYLGNILVRTLK